MKEAQQVVAEKTSALEAEAYKTKRLHVSTVTSSLEILIFFQFHFNYFCNILVYLQSASFLGHATVVVLYKKILIIYFVVFSLFFYSCLHSLCNLTNKLRTTFCVVLRTDTFHIYTGRYNIYPI